MSREPSFQFYPGDWLRDANLRRCTAATRGIWMDMLCLMFQCERRGVLATGGEAWTHEEIARALPGDSDSNLAAIKELLKNRVAYVEEGGAIYSKRMVLDEKERVRWRESKRAHKDSRPDSSKAPGPVPLDSTLTSRSIPATFPANSRPSSSSSSSSSSILKTSAAKDAAGVPIPLQDWIPLDAWASYMKLRKEKRAKVTPDAVDLLIRKLAAWRAEGQDVREILERSVMNGWTGIFPLPKENANGRTAGPKSFDAARNEGTDAALRRVLERGGVPASQTGANVPARIGRNGNYDLHGGTARPAGPQDRSRLLKGPSSFQENANDSRPSGVRQ